MDTHEIAWAAGFFDGDGGLTGDSIYIGQSHRRDTLDRFHKAVLDIGIVFGPYANQAGNPHWVWRANGFEKRQTVVALLWNYLSPISREKILSRNRSF